jgi:excisionase family DNA binding protein
LTIIRRCHYNYVNATVLAAERRNAPNNLIYGRLYEIMETQIEKLLLKPSEVFSAIGVSRAKGYAMLAAGELPSIRIGRSVRVPLVDLRVWVEQQKAKQEWSKN